MITKDTTVGEILRTYPSAAQILAAHGICDCCGGGLNIEEHARAQKIDIGQLLKKLNEAK